MNTELVPLEGIGALLRKSETLWGIRVTLFAYSLLVEELVRRDITPIDLSPVDHSNLLVVTPGELGGSNTWRYSEVIEEVKRNRPNSRLFPVQRIFGLLRSDLCRSNIKTPIIIATNPIAKKFGKRVGHFILVISDDPFTDGFRMPTLYVEERGSVPTVTENQNFIFWRKATN